MAASFQHFAMWDEALELVRIVNETHHVRLVVEQSILAKPRAQTFDRYTPALAKLLAEDRILQLEGPFTKHPLRFEKRDEGEYAGTYWIDTMSGPRLRWILPLTMKRPGKKPELGPGSLTYIKSYENPKTGRFEPASAELKAAYQAIVATLKKHMVRAKRRRSTIWIGKQSKQAVDEGAIDI